MADEQGDFELDLSSVVWCELADGAAARAVLDLPQKLSCHVLRYTPRRRVLYISGPPALIVKQFFRRGALDRVKNIWRGAPARREWGALRVAAERGLEVPRVLALGRLRRGSTRQTLLVTEFVEGAPSLEEILGGLLPAQKKHRLIRRAALSIRAMHDKGYYQRDLHLGNLLYREDGPVPKVFFLDLQRVDVDPLRPAAKRWRDLATLHGGCHSTSRSDRLRFIKAYLSMPPGLSGDERRLLGRLDKAGWRHRLQIWRSREKRCLADNREFSRVRIGRFRGSVRCDAWPDEAQGMLAEPSRLLSNATIVKDSRTTTVGRVALGDRQLFIKRYNYQGAVYALKNVFRASRAKRVWRAGNGCRLRGVGVALPVAYLESRRWRLLCESYLITRAVPGNELHEVLARQRGDLGAKRELLRALALALRKMHDRGVAHRDLKAENLMVRACGKSRYDLRIIDFDGLVCKAVSWRRRAKNSARLLRAVGENLPISAADRLRFVKSYLGPRPGPRECRVFRRIVKRI